MATVQVSAERLQQLEERLAKLEQEYDRRIQELEAKIPEERVTIVVFSGDLDRALAAFIIATGALAMGYQCSMYFTFWGLSVIKKQAKKAGKSLPEKMFSMMLPENASQLGLSKMNFFGVGSKMMRSIMKQKNVATLEDLMETAQSMGARIISCTMAMDIMGVQDDEIREGCDFGGVGTFLGDAFDSRVTLFI